VGSRKGCIGDAQGEGSWVHKARVRGFAPQELVSVAEQEQDRVQMSYIWHFPTYACFHLSPTQTAAPSPLKTPLDSLDSLDSLENPSRFSRFSRFQIPDPGP
jgi:hypothetical protein